MWNFAICVISQPSLSFRNVTLAARRLHVAQPALSRQIQDLEEELGVKLLERSTRGIKLTEAGKFFADEAVAVLARAEQALRPFVPSPAARPVNSASVTRRPGDYPRALAAFQKAAPGVRVTFGSRQRRPRKCLARWARSRFRDGETRQPSTARGPV